MTITSAKDAKALLAVRIGDEPLVPVETRAQGAGAVVAAALKRLLDLRRERARVLYRSGDPKRHSRSCNTMEADQ